MTCKRSLVQVQYRPQLIAGKYIIENKMKTDFGQYLKCPKEVTSLEVRPFEVRLLEVDLGEVRPGKARLREVRPGEVRPGEVRLDESRSGEVRPFEVRIGEVRREE